MPQAKSRISPRTVTLRVNTRFERRKICATVSVVGEAHLADGAQVELVMLQRPRTNVVHTRTIRRLLPVGNSEVSFPMERVKSGCCWFRAVLIDRFGVRHPAAVIHETAPRPTSWFGTAEGITRKVPAPWTPVTVRRGRGHVSVECWGRRYDFDGRGFAAGVESAGRPVLAGPVALTARADGKQVRWTKRPLKTVAAEPGEVRLSGQMGGAGLTVSAETSVEFDGMVRVDFNVQANRATRLEALTLEVPVRAEHAKYFYMFPGQWGTAKNAMALPRRGLTLPFRPYVWLGDEQRGLAWFAESDKHWVNRDPNRVTQISRNGEVVTIRLHLVSKPVHLLPGGPGESGFTGLGTEEGPDPLDRGVPMLRYTFGLQATPVKPVEQDAWDHRIVCIGQDDLVGPSGGLDLPTSRLDRLAAAGVRAVVIFEYWADAEGHSRTPHGRLLKRLVKACHARGLKVLLYFSFLISDHAPEWREFGKDCIVLPKGGYPLFHYLPQPEQSAWRVCLKSPWQDFLAEGVAHVMDTYDVDGVYLDGTEYPFGCCNTNHDCGTLRADGSIAPSYPIFGVRSTMRRIYHAVRSRKPDGLVNVHNSTCMTMPTLGWATSYWDGEQFQNIPHSKDTGRIAQLLPLDAFRTEFMGHQWGVPAEFLCYDEPFRHEEAWGFCLVHDVPVRPGSKDKHLDLASSIWKVMDAFGRRQAEWLPYWANQQYVSVRPRDAYVSLYRHADHGVLAAIANLGRKRAKIITKPVLGRLGLSSGRISAKDALSGREVPIDRGAIELELPSFGWKLIWIRPAT